MTFLASALPGKPIPTLVYYSIKNYRPSCDVNQYCSLNSATIIGLLKTLSTRPQIMHSICHSILYCPTYISLPLNGIFQVEMLYLPTLFHGNSRLPNVVLRLLIILKIKLIKPVKKKYFIVHLYPLPFVYI